MDDDEEEENDEGVLFVCQNGFLQKLQTFPSDPDFVSLSTSISGRNLTGNRHYQQMGLGIAWKVLSFLI